MKSRRVQRRVSASKKPKYGQKAKSKFRSSKRWKEFKQEMYERSGGICAVTGARLGKMWQLHHCNLSEEFYEDLNPDNFVCLGWNAHKIVHGLFVKSRPREWRRRVLNLIRILKRMEKINHI